MISSHPLLGGEKYLLFTSKIANHVCQKKFYSPVWYILILYIPQCEKENSGVISLNMSQDETVSPL